MDVTLFGATGLVGGECLRLLMEEPRVARVVAPVRRPVRPIPRGRLEQPVVDYDRLDAEPGLFAVDRVICAIGTTMRKAGSREAFRAVDHDLPLDLARRALDAGVPHFLLVSAIGADPDSRFFYNRVKGELEQALLALPFRSTTILRPSLLLGSRRELRPAEALAKVLGPLLPGNLRAVRAADVARVLVDQARDEHAGSRIIESARIRALARRHRGGKS